MEIVIIVYTCQTLPCIGYRSKHFTQTMIQFLRIVLKSLLVYLPIETRQKGQAPKHQQASSSNCEFVENFHFLLWGNLDYLNFLYVQNNKKGELKQGRYVLEPQPQRNQAAAAAAKLLQSCPTLCDPIDGSPPGSPVPGILQARTLEQVAISFSNA